MNGVEFLVGAEAAGSDGSGVGFGAGMVRSIVGLRRSRVGRVRVPIMHCIYIHVYGGRA